MTSGRSSARWWLPRVLLLVITAAAMIFGILVMRVSPDTAVAMAERIMQEIRGHGGRGLAVFAVVQVLIAVSGVLPASLLGFAAGALYGLLPGFVLAAVSTLIGAMLAFTLSRSLFRPVFTRLASRRPRLRDLDVLIARDGWKLVCLLRVSPIMPFSATSYLLGLSSIDMRDYLLGTLGSLPALAGYVFLGTLADASLTAWISGASPFRWAMLAIGGGATILLTIRMGQIAFKLGLTSRSSTHDASLNRR